MKNNTKRIFTKTMFIFLIARKRISNFIDFILDETPTPPKVFSIFNWAESA